MANKAPLWLQMMLDLIGQGVFLCGLASNFISAAWCTGENSSMSICTNCFIILGKQPPAVKVGALNGTET